MCLTPKKKKIVYVTWLFSKILIKKLLTSQSAKSQIQAPKEIS